MADVSISTGNDTINDNVINIEEVDNLRRTKILTAIIITRKERNGLINCTIFQETLLLHPKFSETLNTKEAT